MHQKHTSLSFEFVYVSPTAASSLSARFLFVTVPPPCVSARLKAHLMHHKKTEEDERVGEAREGGRRRSLHFRYTFNETPYCKTKKATKKQKNPLKPSNNLKNMHNSSQTDAAKTHVIIKSCPVIHSAA